MQGTCGQGLDTSFIALGYGKVAVLGVVQGITELMPISSTAHMRIVPALLGWPDPGSAFSATMQLAALAAVVSYFWADVKSLTVGAVTALIRRDWGTAGCGSYSGLHCRRYPSSSLVGRFLPSSTNAILRCVAFT